MARASASAASVPRRAPPRRGERGQVLLIVTALGLLAMAAWGLAWRATHDAIRTERVVVQRAQRTASVLPALAHGAAALRGGHPPSDPYECLDTIVDGTDSWDCRLLFTSQGSAETWVVSCRLATPAEAASLPALPVAFSD
jgi:hypothetical protein